jgi:hypothetical protein
MKQVITLPYAVIEVQGDSTHIQHVRENTYIISLTNPNL